MESPREFFERYRADWMETHDGSCIARFYGEPCLTLRADGSFHVLSTNEDIAKFFQQVIDAYLQQGMDDFLIVDFTAVGLGGRSAFVTLDWDARRADGTQIRQWRQSYNLIEMAGNWKIVLSTFHVD
jgi:hypothetical protein